MWIFMQDSFLSVTEHEVDSKLLEVSSRMRGDIERIFPEADVIETITGDYRFCTTLPRERVVQAISLRVGKIKYPSFHSTVADADRRAAYINVWSAMYDEQQRLYGPPPPDSDAVVAPRPRYELEDPRYSLDMIDDEIQVEPAP